MLLKKLSALLSHAFLKATSESFAVQNHESLLEEEEVESEEEEEEDESEEEEEEPEELDDVDELEPLGLRLSLPE